MARHKILIIEDDAAMTRLLVDNLVHEGFDVAFHHTGDGALNVVRDESPDLVLLDAMLPGTDGFQLCRAIARRSTHVPVIMLTARNQPEDRMYGFRAGADDYVAKPFHIDELLARIRAVLRRARPVRDTIALGDIIVDFRRMQATRSGRDLGLSFRELELLQYLAEREGGVVSRHELLSELWGYEDSPLSRTVDMAIGRLRRKIERDPHAPRHLLTAHGGGYRLVTG